MSDIFEFIKKPYSLRINSDTGQRIQTIKYGIKTKEHGIESFFK